MMWEEKERERVDKMLLWMVVIRLVRVSEYIKKSRM